MSAQLTVTPAILLHAVQQIKAGQSVTVGGFTVDTDVDHGERKVRCTVELNESPDPNTLDEEEMDAASAWFAAETGHTITRALTVLERKAETAAGGRTTTTSIANFFKKAERVPALDVLYTKGEVLTNSTLAMTKAANLDLTAVNDQIVSFNQKHQDWQKQAATKDFDTKR